MYDHQDIKAMYSVTSSIKHSSFFPGMNRIAQTAKAAGKSASRTKRRNVPLHGIPQKERTLN
jgi:hypothetical protein